MARGDLVKRHRVGISSGVALLLASGAVVALALDAKGYKRHETQLNDGGIWVVNGDKGIHGRLNKPINQIDGVVPEDRGELRLDVVQDGAVVVAVNETSSQGRAVDPRRLVFPDGGTAALPEDGDVRLAGGTLAAVERRSGRLWATRVDSQTGELVVTAVDRQADELADVGADASLAVTLEGTVVAVSAAERTLTTLDASAATLAEPAETELPGGAGSPDTVTAVGERVVTLDSRSGRLAVVGGRTATVPEMSVLQQAGPAADAVLVGAPDGLLAVDLDSGEVSVVAEATGTPVEPVRLGSCVYGAWSGGMGVLATRCGDSPAEVEPLGGQATDLAFRVNRGEIVLNDALTGALWDVDLQTPIRANWNDFTSKKQKDDEDEQEHRSNRADRRPPLAKPDSYGVRPGRTTVLHPLDNDSAPEGRLLSIVEVAQPPGGATAEISPDGQSIVLTTPDRARPMAFDYFIDDGRTNATAHATIDVRVRGAAQNSPPRPRRGYEPKVYRVPARGALSVPVLGDWRDDSDGDPLLLESARPVGAEPGGAEARTTADGRIRFTAPQAQDVGAQTVTVEYSVTDGRSSPVSRRLDFEVQAPQDQRSYAPTAEPDVVRGEVGAPIRIRPLLNDLPGSDPATPHAELSLGGRIPGQAGATISTDRESGIVTFEADKPGTHFLDYDAAYGNAPLARGTIRVDVRARTQRPKDPVAMPDTLTLYGQAPGLVDVLANDLDPSGGLLVVQQATPITSRQLDVAIVDGRWLRISAGQPDLVPQVQRVGYTISNGSRSGVRGEVVVTQRPEPPDNTPVTVTDRVVVRAGSAVSAAVLDNDVSPSGDRLSLVSDAAEGTPGELRVVRPVDVEGDVGKAYVTGRLVRYVAPARIDERDTYEVPYDATNTSRATARGRLLVTVVPAGEKNTAPQPPTLEARVVSGDTVKVRLPGSGIDAEGDPVTVTGITVAPRLGRIVATGGNFVEYQAYPRGGVGTDTFSFAVVDSQGALGTGTARIAVVTAGAPQPPLAVADSLLVEPGRTATFDPMANDFVAPGDRVEVSLVDPPAGVRLDPDTRLVTMPAPERLEAPATTVVYELDNGVDQSRSTMTLDTAEHYENPPVVHDAFGRAEDSGSVVVDVLEGAYDPDGPLDQLSVVKVHGQPDATIDGGRIRVQRAEWPKVVPFRVEDAGGAVSSASLYVPPTGDGLPYVRPDALVELAPGKTATGRLGDFIVTPDGSPLRLTGRSALATTPVNALSAEPRGRDGFALTAAPDHRGPGALLVEVTTAADSSGNEDAGDATDGFTVTLSIPVQVGDDKPVLTCPTSAIPISTGESHEIDLASYCDVWTLDPRDAAGLSYAAAWTEEIPGVALAGVAGSVVGVQASEDATEGGTAVLRVRAGGSNAQDLSFRLAKAPPPRMLPVKVADLRAGESRTIDLAPYLEGGVAEPEPTVVSVAPVGGAGVRASAQGSRVTLTATKGASGEAAFRVVMSDVAREDPPEGRLAEGRLSFKVGGTPGAPSEPRVIDNSRPGRIRLAWRPPSADGGAPITHYQVREERSGRARTCRSTVCDYPVDDDRRYYFRVRAVNKVGAGPWSGLSQQAVTVVKPGRVDGIKMVRRGDGQITLRWDSPGTGASRILRYWVGWDGVDPQPVVDTSFTATGLDNNRSYTFSIRAESKAGLSDPRVSAPMQSAGTPAPPASVSVGDLNTGMERTTLRVSWAATAPNGPAPVTYTLLHSRDGASPVAVSGCAKIQATTCNHAGIEYSGSTYVYSVRAHNAPGNTSPPSETASFEAVGRPAPWGSWTLAATGVDQQLRITGTAPDSRGSQSVASILVGNQVAWSSSVRTGAGINQVVSTPTNEGPVEVQLRMCNEHAGDGACSHSDVKTGQSYGPLRSSHLGQPSVTSVSGKTIDFSVSGTGNGRPVRLAVSVVGDGGRVYLETVRDVGPAQFTTGFSAQTQSFEEDVRIFAQISDPGVPRGQAESSTTSQSGTAPAPVITLSRQPCSDDGASGLPRCDGSALGGQCTDAKCGFLVITTTDMNRSYTCTISNSLRPMQDRIRTYDSNGSHVTDIVYYEGYVTVTCDELGGNRPAGSVIWEWR